MPIKFLVLGGGIWGFGGGGSADFICMGARIFLTEALYDWRVPNPPGANLLVAERANGGLRSLVQIPVISSAHLATPVRPQ